MGQVFRATARGAHGFYKTVAVKRILPELAKDPEFVVRFVGEAKLAVSLGHANIVQVFDLARAGDELFLVMEYVDGADLAELSHALREREQRPPPGIVAQIGLGILKGLVYAHERLDEAGRPYSIVHRDLSPSNILVSHAGETKIADFGVAQAVSRAPQATARPVGKLRYLPPEVLRGGGYDVRADLYSLGVVLLELLLGRPLFDGGDRAETAEAVLAGARVADDERTGLPSPLVDLLLRAVAAERGRRPASARVMLSELSDVAAGLSPRFTDPDVGAWIRTVMGAEEGGAAYEATATRTRSRFAESSAPPLQAVSFVARRSDEGTTVWEPASAPVPERRRGLVLAAAAATLAVLAAIVLVWRAAAREPVPRVPVLGPAVSAPVAAVAPAVATPTPPPAPAAPSSGRTVREAKPRGQGYVNVYADPWAYVYVDGRKRGLTPLMRLALPAGAHSVTLKHPDLRSVERRVVVVPGQTQLLDVTLGP